MLCDGRVGMAQDVYSVYLVFTSRIVLAWRINFQRGLIIRMKIGIFGGLFIANLLTNKMAYHANISASVHLTN